MVGWSRQPAAGLHACIRNSACAVPSTLQTPHTPRTHRLHPDRFRTELCQYGLACNRPVCFFAHSQEQLRTAPPDLPPAELCWQTGASLRFGRNSSSGSGASSGGGGGGGRSSRGKRGGGGAGSDGHGSPLLSAGGGLAARHSLGRQQQHGPRSPPVAAFQQLHVGNPTSPSILGQMPLLAIDRSGSINSSSTMHYDLNAASWAGLLSPGPPGAGGLHAPSQQARLLPQSQMSPSADHSAGLGGVGRMLNLACAGQQPQQQQGSWVYLPSGNQQVAPGVAAAAAPWQQQQGGENAAFYPMLPPSGPSPSFAAAQAMQLPAAQQPQQQQQHQQGTSIAQQQGMAVPTPQQQQQVMLVVMQQSADGSLQPVPGGPLSGASVTGSSMQVDRPASYMSAAGVDQRSNYLRSDSGASQSASNVSMRD